MILEKFRRKQKSPTAETQKSGVEALDPITSQAAGSVAMHGLQAKSEALALSAVVKSKPSSELKYISQEYVGGNVRRYGDRTRAMRTEIDLPDGRQVAVHRNMEGVGGLAASRLDAIVVSKDDETIGAIRLEANQNSSPYNPSYNIWLGDRQLAMSMRGGHLDLDIADALLDRAISNSNPNFHPDEGYAPTQWIAQNVIQPMQPGYTQEAFDPDIFMK